MATKPTLTAIAAYWIRFGLISWGGMHAMLPRMEAEMMERGWATREEFRGSMATSVLVPGPTFLSLAGITGYRLRGYAGAGVSILSLMVPPTLLVAGAMVWLTPDLLGGPIRPITRGLTVAIAGVLMGNTVRLARREPTSFWRGPSLLAMVTLAILLGVPVPAVVLGGLLLGAFLLRGVPGA